MICDPRFESQIAIAVNSRDLEHFLIVFERDGGGVDLGGGGSIIWGGCVFGGVAGG